MPGLPRPFLSEPPLRSIVCSFLAKVNRRHVALEDPDTHRACPSLLDHLSLLIPLRECARVLDVKVVYASALGRLVVESPPVGLPILKRDLQLPGQPFPPSCRSARSSSLVRLHVAV